MLRTGGLFPVVSSGCVTFPEGYLPAECGSSVINNEGILLSPNYPMNYDNNHECIYSIQVQAGKGINISARTFHLAQGDILKIYDGNDNTAHVLGAFTGSSMLGLTLISTSNHLWLEFYSDIDATGEGFKLVYSSFELSHCEDPGVPQFGFKVNDQGHFSGSTITYKCNPGYTLHGSGVLKCMTGERRAWDNPLPSCIGKFQCLSCFFFFVFFLALSRQCRSSAQSLGVNLKMVGDAGNSIRSCTSNMARPAQVSLSHFCLNKCNVELSSDHIVGNMVVEGYTQCPMSHAYLHGVETPLSRSRRWPAF
ncbi:hypothetical protein P4O66_003590 [Electrophorus voltai]|uniref:CUB and Sushi multiple domains 3a n=1 Tax=Electrophorus voltai TaxID=2609070 RepID=A0AAD9E521_9TELE|nr:hypothetical protein P4O66_003590 [Electrophorus voltai]